MSAPRRAGRAIARRWREGLSNRELAVVTSVSTFRYLTVPQVEELHFSDHASPETGSRICRRVLERLADGGVLWRLERRVGGVHAGSATYVYGLGALGHRILESEGRRRVRRCEPSLAFLDHTLAVAELAVGLHRLAREGAVEIGEIIPEPACWRRFSGGLEGDLVLKPDLAAAIQTGEYELRWFVEVDLGTHSAAAALRKCRLYQRYWRTGAEQDHHGIFPQVLFVTPLERRAALLQRTLESAHDLKTDLFAVTTTTQELDVLAGGPS